MERLLALEMIRVTKAAAIASARLMGRGDTMDADRIVYASTFKGATGGYPVQSDARTFGAQTPMCHPILETSQTPRPCAFRPWFPALGAMRHSSLPGRTGRSRPPGLVRGPVRARRSS
jgi:Bacterial fructose-1,6-bisphosphatase, glpX-encoded